MMVQAQATPENSARRHNLFMVWYPIARMHSSLELWIIFIEVSHEHVQTWSWGTSFKVAASIENMTEQIAWLVGWLAGWVLRFSEVV